MKNTLQLRYTLADVADVKKGMYYVAEKSGGYDGKRPTVKPGLLPTMKPTDGSSLSKPVI